MLDRLRDLVRRRSVPLLLAALAATVHLAHGTYGWLRGDPLMYVAVMKGVVTSGNWFDLRLGDDLYFNKPPLFFWYGASLMHVLGTSVYVARLIGTLPSIALVLATWAVVRSLSDPRRAILAAAAVATCRIFGRYGGEPQFDSSLTFCWLLAIAAIAAGERDRRWSPLFWGAVGLGCLVKGPAGLVPLAIAPVWSLLRRRAAPWNDGRFWCGAVLLPILVAPWLLGNWLAHGDRFVEGYFVKDLAATVANVRGTEPAILKYSRDSLTEWLPWLPLAVHGAWLVVRRAVRGDRDPLGTLAIAWTAVWGVAVLCFPTAYTRYLLPFLPAFGVFVAESVAALRPALAAERIEGALRAVVVVAWAALAWGPIRTVSQSPPEIVALAPVLRAAGADSPVPHLDRRLSRHLAAGAVVYLDTTVRLVKPEDVAAAAAERGRCVVLTRVGGAVPPGLTATALSRAGDFEVTEFRPAAPAGGR